MITGLIKHINRNYTLDALWCKTCDHGNYYLAVHNSVEPFKLVDNYSRNTEPYISSAVRDREMKFRQIRQHLKKCVG